MSANIVNLIVLIASCFAVLSLGLAWAFSNVYSCLTDEVYPLIFEHTQIGKVNTLLKAAHSCAATTGTWRTLSTDLNSAWQTFDFFLAKKESIITIPGDSNVLFEGSFIKN